MLNKMIDSGGGKYPFVSLIVPPTNDRLFLQVPPDMYYYHYSQMHVSFPPDGLLVKICSRLTEISSFLSVQEVCEENRELLRQALEEEEEKLKKKYELIQQIRAIESLPILKHKFVDLTEVSSKENYCFYINVYCMCFTRSEELCTAWRCVVLSTK